MGDSSSDNELKPKTWGGFWDIFGEILVEFLDIQEGDRVFDIGTGGGSVLYPLGRMVGSSGRVIGVETCDHCVKATTAEIKRCKIKNVEMHFMDAREAEFAVHSFDCVTAGFIGWDDYFDFQTLKFKKPDELMNSICRLLKTGGKFGMSTWLLQEDLDWMNEFLTSHSIECRRNYHIENDEGWRMILSKKGFLDIRVLTKSATYTYDTIDIWWKEMMDYDWPVDGKNSDVITDSIKRDAFTSIQNRLTKDGGVPFKRDAIFVTAVR
ncbi:MAG: class I SAM-dependent methyltransferase [Candidatus Thorarchaeota archaeon]